MKKLIVITLCILSFMTQAKLTSIKNRKECVPFTSKQVGESISTYDNLHRLDDNATGTLFAQMTKSKSYKLSSDNKRHMVEFVIQPVGYTAKDAAFLPHFYVNCQVSYNAENFEQKCDQTYEVKTQSGVKTLAKFAVNKYSHKIQAFDLSPECADGETLVIFNIEIDTNEQDVTKIKQIVSQESPAIRLIIDLLFDESKFFSNYYEAFFSEWTKTLR